MTAGAVDFANTLGHKLPLFIGVVVLLSALLLMIVFRSLVIPLQAAVMNLLSIGASLGVIVVIFQWGWFGGLIGVQHGPIESFIPVMLFAIVFGLSMDYEVFLVSRIHERWTHTRDTRARSREGLALTGRVVTAAAAIMVCVFLSFMLGEDRVIKEFGLSLASAVFLDALVDPLPAAARGAAPASAPRTWRIPAWLDRLLPRAEHRGHGPAARRPAGEDGRSPRTPPGARGTAARRGDRGGGGLSPSAAAVGARPPCSLCARRALIAPRPRGRPDASGRRAPPTGSRRRARSCSRSLPAGARAARRGRSSRASTGCRSGSCPPRQGTYSTDAAAARHRPGRAHRHLGLRARRSRRRCR